MIDQSKISMFKGQFFCEDDPRIQKVLTQWNAGTRWQMLDRIQTTEAEMSELTDKMCAAQDSSSDLLVNPALEEFTIRCEDNGQVAVICFRRSALYGEQFGLDYGDGASVTARPYVDAYVYLNNDGIRLDAVITIGQSTISCEAHSITASFQEAIWQRHDGLYRLMCATYPHEAVEYPRGIKLMYMAVQYAFLNRPTVFRESIIRTSVSSSPRKKSRRSQNNSLRTVKLLRIDYAVLESMTTRTTHAISCPCWGVAGHWRNYRSGARVWIKPYRKGRERQNEEMYLPKKYVVCEEAQI